MSKTTTTESPRQVIDPSLQWQLLEGPLVQLDEQFGDGAIELGQASALPVAQPGQDPALDQQHRAFDLGLGVSPELHVVQRLKRP